MFLKIIIPSRPIIKYHSIVRSISLSTTNYRIANDSNAVYIFDRYTKSLQRERASAAQDVNLYDYLKDEVGYRIADRVFDINRKFTLAADIGCGRGYVSKHLSKDSIDQLILCDVSKSNLEASSAMVEKDIRVETKILDEENIEFEPNSLDLVVSSLALHWVNDLPKAFKQILNALREDGVFLASVFGGDTLYELRSSLQLAEQERQGGISPHISPFTEVRDIGSLLTNAGFSMLTIDTDEIIVNYPSMFELMWDLKDSQFTTARNKLKLNETKTSYEDKSNNRFKRANYENYTEKVVQMGDEAHFPCYIEKENTTVLWVKVDKNTNNELNITVNYTTVHMDKRFKQMKQNGSKNWQLSIKYTQKTDEGLYLCKSTSNPVTKMYYELILIEAIARILDTDEKETGIIRVKLFSPLRLSCVLYNSISPPLYIFWYHYDTMINYDLEDNASVRHGRQGSELIFPKTEARHQGNYSCVPSNARQASIVVDVHGEIKKATSKGRKTSIFEEMILSIVIYNLFNFLYS